MLEHKRETITKTIKEMSKPKLTDEAKMLIDKFLIRRFLIIGTAFSIFSFLLGFFIKDIAKAEAYNEAYSNASQMIIKITNDASQSANKMKELEVQFNKLTAESEKVLKEATDLKDKVKTTLVIQQSSEIVSAVTNNLANNVQFQNSVIGNTSFRLNQLENKTRNITVDVLGNTIFKNDVKIFGVMEAYEAMRGLMPNK